MNLVTIAEQLGFKLTQPEKNLLTKLEADYSVKVLVTDPATQAMGNRFGGATVMVSNLIAALVNFVYGCDTGFFGVSYYGKKVQVPFFDRVRHLVLKLDSKAYYALLD